MNGRRGGSILQKGTDGRVCVYKSLENWYRVWKLVVQRLDTRHNLKRNTPLKHKRHIYKEKDTRWKGTSEKSESWQGV